MQGIIRTRALALGAALAFVVGGESGVTALASTDADKPASRPSSQVLATGVSSLALAPTATARWSGAVDVTDRAAVNAAYLRDYAAGTSVPIGFSGSESTCRAGSTTTESRAATLRAVNFVRSLGGLAPVTFSSTLNARSQQTALIMSANRRLSHYPSSSWRCYTSTGAANAAKSNLALAYPSLTSAGLVQQYMKDAGTNNTAVGHRRWVMNPFATSMGSGATETANAMTVIGPTSSTRPNPSWVSWPTAGHFPDALEPAGRWSLSAGSGAMNFRYASVRVYRDGALLNTVKQPVHNGYARPTIVWEMPDDLARSGTFRVVVSGIRRSGTTKRYTRSYTVTMFTPSS